MKPTYQELEKHIRQLENDLLKNEDQYSEKSVSNHEGILKEIDENNKKLQEKNEEHEALNEELKEKNEEYEVLNEELKESNKIVHEKNTELLKSKKIVEKINSNVTAIIENTTDSIWAINPTYELIYINNKFKVEFNQSFGIKLHKGVNLLNSLPIALRPLWKTRYDRALNNERFSFEDKIEVAQNIYVYIHVAVNPILVDDKVIGASFFGMDITNRIQEKEELVKAKERAEENEERFKALHNASFGGIAIHKKGIILNCNLGLSEITGYSVDELIGMDVFKLIDEKTRDKVLQNVSSRYEKPYEVNGLRKNGDKYPVRLEAREIRYKGKDARVVEFRDITEQKLAEKKQNVLYNISKYANESNDLQSFIYKIHKELSNLINTENFYIALNHSYYKYSFPYFVDKYDEVADPEELFEMQYSLTDYVLSNAKPVLMDQKKLEELESEGKIKLIGKLTEVWLGAPMFDSQGKAIGVVAVQDYEFADTYSQNHLELLDFVARNIGSLIEKINMEQSLKKSLASLKISKENAEKSEEQLRLISDNLVNGMIYQVVTLNDDKRKFNYVSDAVYKLYGCTAEEAKNDSDLIYGRIHKDDISRLVEEEKEAIKNMNTFKTEVRVMNPDDSIRWSYYISKPRIIDGYICWDGIEVDITDRKRIENELVLAKEKAEESDRFKSAFLANMSHEIRTPMNGIIGFADLLKNRDLIETKKNKFISIINNNCDQLLGIVNDIIDISKIETGQIDIYNEEVDINILLDEIYFSHSHSIEDKKLDFSVLKTLNDDMSTITTDKVKLRQILDNLLNNALKFTHKGYVKFGYSIDNNNLEFFVKDTGIGISKNEQKTIFGQFNQAKIDTAQNYGGTGLGLSIAKAYVEKLGGKMWLKSEENFGSAFYFTISYNPINHQKNKLINESQEENLKNKLCILVVEDDLINYLLIENILLKMNVNLLHAEKGSSAIEIYKNNPQIDLVLMDIKLPDISGLEVTKKFKSIRKDIPIIAQTAFALEGDKEKALNAGCIDYISKPIIAENLVKMINQYV